MLLDLKTLFAKYNLTCAGVVHVGANVGEERHLYKKLGLFRQVWFEANPDLYPTLVKNLTPNPDATAIDAAIGSFDGGTPEELVPLYIADNAGQSSSLLKPKLHLEKHPEVKFKDMKWVPVGTLDTMLHVVGVDPTGWLLTIDVQGAELDVLKGASNSLAKFKAIYTELNAEELYEGCAFCGEIDVYLWDRGFVRVETKWTDKSWGEGLYLKKKCLKKGAK